MLQPPLILKGAILGFSIAAPVGPVGLLCIRRTLQYGRLSGLFSGLGAAIADTFYGLIAALGFSFIADCLLAGQIWFRLLGGAFLIYLGGRTFFAPSRREEGSRFSHKTLLSDFFSTLFLTLSNPLTIISFLAIFAALGLIDFSHTHWQIFELVFGIFLGSSFWWFLLSEGVTLFRKKVSEEVMTWVNRIAGLLIVSFGLFAWLSLLHFKSP